MFQKIKPQVMTTIIGAYLDFPDGIIGTAIGGVIALSMKILEGEG